MEKGMNVGSKVLEEQVC